MFFFAIMDKDVSMAAISNLMEFTHAKHV